MKLFRPCIQWTLEFPLFLSVYPCKTLFTKHPNSEVRKLGQIYDSSSSVSSPTSIPLFPVTTYFKYPFNPVLLKNWSSTHLSDQTLTFTQGRSRIFLYVFLLPTSTFFEIFSSLLSVLKSKTVILHFFFIPRTLDTPVVKYTNWVRKEGSK